MPLYNMRELLHDAHKGGYAVGSFSVANLECVMGVIQAAEEMRAPIIMQCAETRLRHTPLAMLGPMMVAAARHARVPVAVHLDHGATIPCVQEALALGFTSVMLDGSTLPIAQNIAEVKRVVALARESGAAVEAEVGRVGRGEDGSDCPMAAASIDDCLAMDDAGIDAIAVGIGNAHGLYAATPELRYDILEQLSGKLRSYLVLHGGTGLTDGQFVKLIGLGMRKINIATDIFRAAALAPRTDDIFRNITDGAAAVKLVTQKYIALFGSAGKAE
ncbi:MAG: class II fructose-bisphosphate aldolase [Clostridia bacterium]|nr:class II fructose-bisphosphate aldolase [Clostridia bacterium]